MAEKSPQPSRNARSIERKRILNRAVDLPVKSIIMAPWLLGAALMLVAAHNDSDVASRQATTVGKIVAHEPSNHNRYGYRFQVEGQVYTGSETPRKAEPRIGQSVTIYYDADNPVENALTDYRELSSDWSERAVAFFFAACIAFVGIFLAERLVPTRSATPPSDPRATLDARESSTRETPRQSG